ncbi:signal peptidase I [Arthrobacter sp. PL16]|nr:signal peptidase I [Arthrobacter sp. PL16]
MNREEPGHVPVSSRFGLVFSADGWVSFVAFALSRLYLGVVLSLALIAILPLLLPSLNWHGTVVQSGSMEPHISAGDVVLAAPLEPRTPAPVGGVVEYTSPAFAEPSGVDKTRLHRIVAENTDGTFVTAGDANADVDSTPLTLEQITGQARLLVPMIGLPGLWLNIRDYSSLAWWSALTLLAIVMALFGGPRSDPHDKDADEEDPAGSDGVAPSGVAGFTVRVGAAAGMTAVILALVVASGIMSSTAAFTATTVNSPNTFGAAADWTPPSVTMVSPGPSVQATTALAAEASDTETAISNITIEYQADGGTTWTAVCTVTTAPYACDWNTRSVPDGSYSLRATATSTIGLSATSAEVHTTVSNTFMVTLADPGDIQRGTVVLAATLSGSGSRSYSVRTEYSLAGSNRWSALCTTVAAPYNCAWNTGGLANDYYDLRAVAVSGSTTTYSETITDVLVDNLAPVVTLSDPGTPLSGTRTFTATATDAHSGIAQVQMQYNRTGTPTWTTMCTIDTAPFSCRFDTTTLTAGAYNFRAIATDAAGTSTTSAVVSNRTVDNTIASVSVEDPGAYLTGIARLTASANSTAGIRQVRIQSAPTGTTAWTTRCIPTVTPYSCDWDTKSVPDGLYDLRAVLTDNTGRETLSATVSARRVDNSPLRGADIQTTNGPGTPGALGAGDSMTFTYSQQVNTATVVSGWTGAALPVTVRLRDGNLLGLGNIGDTVDIQRSGTTVNLGTVNLMQNYVRNRKTATFIATMTATTVTTNGVPRTVITVALGAASNGPGNLRTTITPSTMIWNPTTAVASTTGTPSSNAPVTETGPFDRDF